MILKLSVLNNINIKYRTRNKIVSTPSPKSSSPRPLRTFSIVFFGIGKSMKNFVITLKMVAYYGKTNKHELSKLTTRKKVDLSFT